MKIQLNGAAISYADRGLPQGTPVVFIHGFPFNHTMWDPQMRALPNHFRAITYDIRGHGQSDVGDGQYSIELFVDDFIGLLDHLVIRQAVVCGLSMGGYIALRAIERHPERFRGLILCDTRSEADSDEGKIKRSAAVKSVKKGGVEAFAASFVKAVFAPETFRTKPDAVETIRKMIVSNSPLGIGGTLLAMAARTDTTKALSGIRVPTLILVGEHDALTPPSSSQAMHERIPSSQMHVLPGAAHMSNIENAGEFNRHLLEFLEQFKT